MFAIITLPHSIDIAFFAIILIACIAGAIRGASGEIARLLSLLCGAAALFLLYKLFFSMWGNRPLGFTLGLISAILVVLLVNHYARKFIRLLFGQPADSVVGAIMAIIGAFLVSTMLLCGMVIVISDDAKKDVFKHSYAGRLTRPIVERIVSAND